MSLDRLFKIVFIAISLLVTSVLSVGCEVSPSTSTPGSVTTPPAIPSSKSTPTLPASTYPADISGRVIIPEFLHIKNFSDKRAKANQEFWVVDISTKNKSYEHVVTSDYEDWHIAAGGEVYYQWEGLTQILHLLDEFTVDDMNVHTGQTGQTTICFSVPDTLKVSDAKICYQGQEPYSYGKLTGGDKVTVYDWDLKKVIEEALVSGELYNVPAHYDMMSTKQLNTIVRWSGTESKVINFSVDKSPWVINAKTEVISSLGHNFDYFVFTEDEYSVPENALQSYIGHEFLMQTRLRTDDHYLVKQSGKFVICVYASGVKWELKVGVE